MSEAPRPGGSKGQRGRTRARRAVSPTASGRAEAPHGFDAYEAAEHEHFDSVIGLEYGDISGDRVTASIVTGPRHQQPLGLVHGGVYAGVVESVASVAASVWAYENLDGQVAIGVSNATDFLRPHREGRLDAVAEPLHRGRRQQLWQVVITRADDGKVVARGQVRLQNVEPDPDTTRADDGKVVARGQV
ncbi:MAG: PaaI family thioesterase, partial [Nitriliruptorales bacterium]